MKFLLVLLTVLTFAGCNSLENNLRKLKSNYAKSRCEGIYWLYYNGHKKINQKLLIDALKRDENELVRSLAARLMGLEGKTVYVYPLLMALNDPKSLVRIEAAQSLGTLKSEEALTRLGELLEQDSNIYVKLKILKTINHMNAKKAVPDLIEALDDEEPAVSFQSLMLLEKFTNAKAGLGKNDWKEWLKENKSKS